MRPVRLAATAAAAASILLAGCPRTELTARYRWAGYSADPNGSGGVVVRISQTSIPSSRPPEASTILLGLKEKGQAAYIRTAKEVVSPSSSAGWLAKLGRRAAGRPAASAGIDAESFLSLLRAPVKKKADPSMPDRLLLKRRIVIALEKRKPRPADRIDVIRLELDKLTGGTFAKVSWTHENPLAVVLGEVTRKDAAKLTGELSGSAPSPAVSVEGGLSFEKLTEITEKATLSDLGFETLVVGTDQAHFSVTAPVGIDLSGMVTIDLSIRLKTRDTQQEVVELGQLRNKDGIWIKPEDVKLKWARIPIVDTTDPLEVRLRGDYRLREVFWGDDTTHEGDDCVTFRTGKIGITKDVTGGPPDRATGKSLTLASKAARHRRNHFYQIIRRLPRGGRLFLIVQTPLKPVVIRFDSLAKTRQFLEWLYEKEATKIGTHQLYLGDIPLTKEHIAKLKLTYELQKVVSATTQAAKRRATTGSAGAAAPP